MSDFNRHDDEELELARLLARKRAAFDEVGDLQTIYEAIEAQNQPGIKDVEEAERAFDKWRIVHKYIHNRPFLVKSGLKRSDEWREVAKRYALLGDAELDEWIALQIEVAQNLENGISDLRVRRDGPCYLIILEYAGNKKRTALAVLHWAQADAR